MPTPAQVNVSDVIDRSKVTNFHIGVFVLCALCLIMDGFDVQAIGYVAPALSRDWHITGRAAGFRAQCGADGRAVRVDLVQHGRRPAGPPAAADCRLPVFLRDHAGDVDAPKP